MYIHVSSLKYNDVLLAFFNDFDINLPGYIFLANKTSILNDQYILCAIANIYFFYENKNGNIYPVYYMIYEINSLHMKSILIILHNI